MWAEFAPAKINLTLEITGKREDGYHTIESLIVFADCGDRITARPSGGTSLIITGPFASGLEGQEEDNLVMKALRAVETARGSALNIEVTLEKNLPLASGIGGGSADAAAMLRILRNMLGKQAATIGFHDIALSLGADMPVCLESKSAFVSGIGEIIHPVKSIPPYGILLVNPQKGLATKEVFGAWNGQFATPSSGAQDVRTQGVLSYIVAHTNALEGAAIAKLPEIAGLLAAIQATPGCILSRMSGSGATCFGLYETGAQSEIAAAAISKLFSAYWVCPARLVT